MIKAAAKSAGCVGAAALAGLLIANSARAETLAPTIDTGSRLDVHVVGTIKSACRIGGSQDIDFGNLTGNERAAAALMLDCNVPFELGLEARNGALTHTTQPQGEGPFSGRLTYRVIVSVPTVSPKPRTLRGEFSSHELAGRISLSSGAGISSGPGTIEFLTGAARGAGLLAGAYSDVVKVTVTPRV